MEYTAWNAELKARKSFMPMLRRALKIAWLNYKYRYEAKSEAVEPQYNPCVPGVGLRYWAPSVYPDSIDALVEKLSAYDVISFDIFDTAIFRKVSRSEDVFSALGGEMHFDDFPRIRRKVEQDLRAKNLKVNGCAETTIDEIYERLHENYDVDSFWKHREVELELALCVGNPYVKQAFQQLRDSGHIVGFMSDMYLSKNTIEKMLQKAGYVDYDFLLLSNEENAKKEDGRLQVKLMGLFPDKKIVHVGDNPNADFLATQNVGMPAILLHKPTAGSGPHALGLGIYEGLVSLKCNVGYDRKLSHYHHGYRVGGILTAGYCMFINDVAHRIHADKILFCARDTYIVEKAYTAYYKAFPSEYIHVSRLALLGLETERFGYDLAGRFIMRYLEKYSKRKTIEAVLEDSSFGFLVPELEKYDIEKYLFPCAIGKDRFEEFLFGSEHLIREHLKDSKQAALKYFKQVVGSAKNVLICDIGWGGSSFSLFEYFMSHTMKEFGCSVHGVLLSASRSGSIESLLSTDRMDVYVDSPWLNRDILQKIMPTDKKTRCDPMLQDYLHMPLEYLYTSNEQSLRGYWLDKHGKVCFDTIPLERENAQEVESMQKGILDFIADWIEVTRTIHCPVRISAYHAFMPYVRCLERRYYMEVIYGNFAYDAHSSLEEQALGTVPRFAELINHRHGNLQPTPDKNLSSGKGKRVLLITPSMETTGAPRSLLRMGKTLKSLGYQISVWSRQEGPMMQEYADHGFTVSVVGESDLSHRENIRYMSSMDLIVCNTIETGAYAVSACKVAPTVWYIREATNLPDFVRKGTLQYDRVLNFPELYCVSDYAAQAIQSFGGRKVRVAENCVEDEVDLLQQRHIAGTGDKVRFVQFGTIEYRKGYDVLLAAYKAMPKKYREQAELCFAGGFVNSQASFASYFMGELKLVPGVKYLGVVRGEANKISTLESMDVVVVASRDESCSLVALEGAMLSKPLIVTENVGAKYMVQGGNGYIVKTADVDDLKKAMMKCIEERDRLREMGAVSRMNYEKMAGMKKYGEIMQAMCDRHMNVCRFRKIWQCWRNRSVFRADNINRRLQKAAQFDAKHAAPNENVIVSLTSHPGRIGIVHLAIESLLNQISQPKKVLLWLSRKQFPNEWTDIPSRLKLLLTIAQDKFEIRWVDGDLKPHKKYLDAMREYPDIPVIIVDDDVRYDSMLVSYLMASYRRHPHCVSCMRANLMTFTEGGKLREYRGWQMDFVALKDIPSYRLLPTGIGGVLYPPKSLPEVAFDKAAINKTCLTCDDIWLKIMTAMNGYPTVLCPELLPIDEVKESKASALWRNNVFHGVNDAATEKILHFLDAKHSGAGAQVVELIHKDFFK